MMYIYVVRDQTFLWGTPYGQDDIYNQGL